MDETTENDPESDPKPQIKFFTCGHGHRLGYVYKRSHILRLVLFTHAQAVDNNCIAGVSIKGETAGYGEWRCNYPGCDAPPREWHPNEEAMRELLEQYLRRHGREAEIALI